MDQLTHPVIYSTVITAKNIKYKYVQDQFRSIPQAINLLLIVAVVICTTNMNISHYGVTL